MKLFGSNFPWRTSFAISRVSRAVFYSTKTRSSSSTALYRAIWSNGDKRISTASLLDRYVENGRKISHFDLKTCIKQLRTRKRHFQALQISEWMSVSQDYYLNSGDVAIHMDLIAKVHGVGKAEEYFNAIPQSLRSFRTHAALLNMYAYANLLDKAVNLFQEMRELDFLRITVPYNVMIGLYTRMGKDEEVYQLLQEMKSNGIKLDSHTYNIMLNSRAVASDIKGVDKLLEIIEADPEVSIDVHSCFIAAKGYLKANLEEKAFGMLKKAERMIDNKGRRFEYEHLITIYASAGDEDEVYRIWNLYKVTGKMYNTGYIAVLGSLIKLGDFEGVERIYQDWESKKICFDYRIANLMIKAYCKMGSSEKKKALAFVERLSSSEHSSGGILWQCLASHCYMDGQMGKAVEFMKKSSLAGGNSWYLDRPTLAGCVEYMKKLGDSKSAHEILDSLRKRDVLSEGNHDRLVDFLNSDKDSGALDAMQAENKNGLPITREIDGDDL